MLPIVFFVIIACMRVVQSVCGKRASIEVKDTRTFFLYGSYYQALAAAVGVISVAITKFAGLNVATVICGAVTAVFLMGNFYAGLNAVKGCKMIISSMANSGGMIVACVINSLWFGEEIGILQCLGLVLFLTAVYLLSDTPKKSKNGDEGNATNTSGVTTKKVGISKKTWLLLALAMVTEGGVEVSQKYFSLRVNGNSAWYSFFMFTMSAAIMFAGFARIHFLHSKQSVQKLEETQNGKQSVATEKARISKILLICGAVLACAVFVVNFLVTELGKRVDSVILFPVSASISSCITVLVGWIVYKEKLTIKNIIGVAAGVGSTILLVL